MQTLEIPLEADRDLGALPPAVEAVAAAQGLALTLKSTLVSYHGSYHWHYRRGHERGILEITFWPARRRLWLKIAAGRSSPGIAQLLPHLQAALSAAAQALPVLVAAQPKEG